MKNATGEAEEIVTDAERLWTLVSDALRPKMTDAAWNTCFNGVRSHSVDESQLTISAPSALARERIRARYLPAIEELVAGIAGRPLAVHIEIHNDAQTDEESPSPGAQANGIGHDPSTQEPPSLGSSAQNERMRDVPAPAGPPRREHTPLNQRYTFDTFVIGASNRFAHAAARCVAETPARAYNPLFIHGGSGLGKTHLLHAIGNYVQEHFRNQHIRYVSTETFMNEFVESIRTNTTLSFKRYYRQCDLLLVDDIHFMEGKEGLQEEFFYTFNTVYEAGRQIVITSDRPPKAIATLEERLRSRFLSGLITDVQPPELETRLAILRQKASAQRVPVPDEVLELIATQVKDNIRELEGAFTRISAFASLSSEPVTRQLAERVLSDIFSDQSRQITPDTILNATSELFGFSVDDLCGPSRRRPLVAARQVSMYVFRELTDFSYPAIAKEFGGRDHTTVIHAVEKITNLMKQNQQLYNQVSQLIRNVRAGG